MLVAQPENGAAAWVLRRVKSAWSILQTCATFWAIVWTYDVYQEVYNGPAWYRSLKLSFEEITVNYWHHNNSLILSVVILTALTMWLIEHRLMKRKYVRFSAEEPRFEPEKMKHGSDLFNADKPSFTAVLSVNGPTGKLINVGMGFLAEDRFYTAYHVVDGHKTIIVRAQQDVEIPVSRFSRLDGDIAIIRLSPGERSVLGLKGGKLHRYSLQGTGGVFCQASGINQASMGIVTSHRSFGFVSYGGSTVNGFSGTPYYVGNTIYGMHVGGGTENLGYEAAYLDVLSKKGLESSEDYLVDLVQKKRKYKYERSPFDPDEFRVVIGDKYFIVDSDTLERLETIGKGSQTSRVTYEGECEYCPGYRREAYDDGLDEFVEEIDEPVQSGNGEAPVLKDVGAGAPGKAKDLETVQRPSFTVKKTRASKSRKASEKLTDGQKRMLAQRNEAFESIARSLRVLRQQQSKLPKQYKNERLVKSPTSYDVGPLLKMAETLTNFSNGISSLH